MMEGHRVKLTEINPYLVCVLCQGYLVDATTIAECLHSFCRSCIFRQLERKPICPICETQVHNTKLERSLRPDKTLQDIVYKLVPGLFHNEMQRRRDFYKTHPFRDDHLEPECRGVGLDRLIYSPDDLISLSLEFYDDEREKEEWSNQGSPKPAQTAPSGPKRYLQCPAGFKMRHLKKFLRQKYGLSPTFNIDILYKRETLPDSYSLMDVAYIYTWKRNSPMRFYYRMPEVVMKQLMIPPPEVPLISNEEQEKEQEHKMSITLSDDQNKDLKKPSENNENKRENENTVSSHQPANAKKIDTHGNPIEGKSEKIEDTPKVKSSETISKNGEISISKQDELPVSVLLSLGQSRVEDKTNDHKFLVPPVPPKNGLTEKVNIGKVNSKLSVNKIAKELAENKTQGSQVATKENMQSIPSQLQQQQHQQLLQKQKQMQLQKQNYYQKKQPQIKQQPLTQQKQQMSHPKQQLLNQQKQQQLQQKQQQLAQQKQHIQHIIQQQQLQHQIQQQQLQQFHQQQLQQLQQQQLQTQQQLRTQQQLQTPQQLQTQQQLHAQQPIHLLQQVMPMPVQQQQIPIAQQVLQVQQCVQQPQVQSLVQPQQVKISSNQNTPLQSITQHQIQTQFPNNAKAEILAPSSQHSQTTQEHSVTSTVNSSQNTSVSSPNPLTNKQVTQHQSPVQNLPSVQQTLPSQPKKEPTPPPQAKQPSPPPYSTPPLNSTPPLKNPTEVQSASPKMKAIKSMASNLPQPTPAVTSTENVEAIVQKSASPQPQPIEPSSQFQSNRNLLSGGNLNIPQNGRQSKSPQLPSNIQQSNSWQDVPRTDISTSNGSPKSKAPQVTLNTSNGSLTIMAQPKTPQNICSPIMGNTDASSVTNGKPNDSPRPQGIHQNLPRTVLPKSPLVNGKAYQKAVPQKNISGQRLNNNLPEMKNGLIQQSNINNRLPTFQKAGNARKTVVPGGVISKTGPTLDQRIQQLYNAGQANKPTSPSDGVKSESRLASWLNNRFKPPQSPKEESEPTTTSPKSEVSVMRYKRKLQELQKDCEITQENPRPDDPKRRREVMPDVSIELMRAADMKKLEGVKKEKRPVPGLKSIQDVGAKRKKEDDSVLDLSSAKPGDGLRPHLPWLLNRPPHFIPRPT